MTNQHPITPPTVLVQKWVAEALNKKKLVVHYVARKAAQWAADQELEACCLWVNSVDDADCFGANLRAARRPKPPSLKEQALAELAEWENVVDIAPDSPIRRALEQLDDQ
jgi:hypothetical protein